MDPTVTVAIISAASVVLAGLFTLLGVRFTQRSARDAARATASLERDKLNSSAYESARHTWEDNVESLRKQVADLSEEAERSRRIGRELRDRVDELESGRDADRARIRELTNWATAVLRIMATHEIPYPPPPAGLTHDGG